MTKHLKLFTSDSERQSFESSNYYVEPYVSIVRGGGSKIDTHYNSVPDLTLIMKDESKKRFFVNSFSGDFSSFSSYHQDIDFSDVKSVEFSDRITEISNITSISGLEELIIPNSVKKIDTSDIYALIYLKKVVLPNTINSLKSGAFNQCLNLESITLTDSLTHIDADTFNGCYNLQELKIIGKKDISSLLPTNLTDNLTELYVDASLIETYETYRDSIGKSFEVKSLT